MNLKFSNRSRRSLRRHSAAFTLIELLVVIAIIGILAALVVGGAGIANSKMRRARVEAEREQLITLIETYKKAKGYYPPDNSNTNIPGYTFQNTLFFELTGCDIQGNPATPPFVYKNRVTTELLTNTSLLPVFGIDGIHNSSTDPNEVVNYFKGLKAGQHAMITGPAPSMSVYSVLGVGVPGPVQLSAAPGGGTTGVLNPWNYNVSNPVNNPGSFDLWMDVYWGGKTNRVCNWSRDPIVL